MINRHKLLQKLTIYNYSSWPGLPPNQQGQRSEDSIHRN